MDKDWHATSGTQVQRLPFYLRLCSSSRLVYYTIVLFHSLSLYNFPHLLEPLDAMKTSFLLNPPPQYPESIPSYSTAQNMVMWYEHCCGSRAAALWSGLAGFPVTEGEKEGSVRWDGQGLNLVYSPGWLAGCFWRCHLSSVCKFAKMHMCRFGSGSTLNSKTTCKHVTTALPDWQEQEVQTRIRCSLLGFFAPQTLLPAITIRSFFVPSPRLSPF